MSKYCKQFVEKNLPCYSPEPHATKTDLIMASMALENAIVAPDDKSCLDIDDLKCYMRSNLKKAASKLHHAYLYLEAASISKLYKNKIKHITNIINNIEASINEIKLVLIPNLEGYEKKKDIKSFASEQLYGFQGVMSALKDEVNKTFNL